MQNGDEGWAGIILAIQCGSCILLSVDLLFIVAPIGLVFGPCFVMQCLVSFLVLHHLAGEEGCLHGAMCSLILCVSSSWCGGLVCLVCLWHFLVILIF